jgi:predicted MFS family arabinose efflux permease
LGGLITTGISWRGIFRVNVPIGIAAIAITATRVQESRVQKVPPPDWIGFVLLTAGLILLVYGLIRASEQSWGDTTVLVCLASGGAALVAFLVAESWVNHPMFDLSLFKVPTFVGGSIAAVAMNASLFSVFLYLVLYLQNVLGFSALGTGLRLLINSGMVLIAATIAGRLSGTVPARWLIGPGLLLVGVGLFLMSGLNAQSQWTHLVAGFAISGIGAGMVNPPLASTAIGVVEPARAGMASGVNATFRQVGLATSIAVQGTIFSSALHRELTRALASNPLLAPHTAQIVSGVRRGNVEAIFSSAPPSARADLGEAIRSSFASGINDLAIFTGIVALVGAVAAVLLIRRKDFVASQPEQAEAGTVPAPAAVG